ncbi:hypothetical protein [Sorangium sp. So ce128]|uniref:hypothetical protein n=1 Tax=Sorangium sp. So ce128 TaxID=3133281 RepID=UPI003F610E7E
MDAMTLEAQEAALLQQVPEDGTPVGNMALMRTLRWTPLEYWPVRNRLVERGVLERGRGKGGSVYRVLDATAGAPAAAAGVPEVSVTPPQEDWEREKSLYAPMAKVIGESWVAAAGFDNHVIQVTAQQGSRYTGGKWSRPDLAVATLSTYPYIPGRHFDVITFEIKTSDGLDVTSVYEALAHLRSATRSYVLAHVPAERAKQLESHLDEIFAEAKKHGVGVIIAGKPDDYDTWEEVVDPVRADPDPRRLNEFLAKQFTKDQLEQLAKWFK